MNFNEAQKEMRFAFLGGGPGIMASAFIWLITAASTLYVSEMNTLLIFFFGGMLIYPLGVLLSKLLKGSGKYSGENKLGILAMESTVILFLGLFLAYLLYQFQSNWFFSIMLMVIGVRYLIFQTIYGLKIYWLFGGVLIVAGVIIIQSNQTFETGVIVGGLIELIFGFFIWRKEKGILT